MLTHSGSGRGSGGCWLLVGFGASVRQLFETLGLEGGGTGPHLHLGVRIGAFRFVGLVLLGGGPDFECDHGTLCGIADFDHDHSNKNGLSHFRKP